MSTSKKNANHGKGKKPAILVVEDNAELNRFLVEALQEDYQVISVFDGRAGFDRARTGAPALIITGLAPAGAGGAQLVADVRGCTVLAEVPILLLAGGAEEKLRDKLLDNGAQDFLTRPFSKKDLQVRVRNLVDLWQAQERNRTLFQSMDEGFCTIEVIFDQHEKPVDYRFLEVNEAFEKQTGLRDARGRRMRELAPDHEQHWFDIYGQVALTGEPIRFENVAEALGHHYEVLAFRAGPAENREVAIFFNDITERIRSARALQEAKADAEAANRSKDQFLASLNHELRTPLTPVLVAAETLGADPRLPVEVREQVRMIERNVALEARIIDDLFDINAAVRGKFRLQTELVDAHYLITLVIDILKDSAAIKNLNIEQDLHAPLSGLQADPTRFQQVIWNLMRNAVKFSPAGRRIRVSTAEVPAPSGGFSLQIKVADAGIGIAPDRREKIFNAFDPGVAAAVDRSGGLGLTMARAIMEAHGGKIWAESDGVNRGSTFVVEFPNAVVPPSGLKELAVQPTPGPVRPAVPMVKSKTIQHLLYVEDHEPTLKMVSTLLTNTGYTVVTAGNVKEALAAAGAKTFDLVIADLGLPDGTGIELMQELHARHGLRGIALSGYGMPEDIERTREAGFLAHLVKPARIAELRRVLANLV